MTNQLIIFKLSLIIIIMMRGQFFLFWELSERGDDAHPQIISIIPADVRLNERMSSLFPHDGKEKERRKYG